VSAAGLVIGCERPTVNLDRPQAPERPRQTIVTDQAMGSLSPIAFQVAAGLQDPVVLRSVFAAMRDSASQGLGIDLQDCGPGGPTQLLINAGAKRGGQAASVLCAALSALPGAILFMDRDQLKVWNPSVIPIVTAVANPLAPLPQHFLGYRSPSKTIDLGADSKLKGPILVVLPIKHPNRLRGLRPSLPASVTVHKDTVHKNTSSK